jgi:hypothetical protein
MKHWFLVLSSLAALFLTPEADARGRPPRHLQQPECTDRPAVGTFTYKLVTVVESDAVPDVVIRFYALIRDNGDLAGLMTHRTDHPVAKIYGLCEVSRGAVRVEQEERIVTQLTPTGAFTAEQGGEIRFSFLHSGIRGSRRYVDFEVARTGAREWSLFWNPRHHQDRSNRFNYLWMQKNTFLGRTIGISHVNASLIDLREYEDYVVPMPRMRPSGQAR